MERLHLSEHAPHLRKTTTVAMTLEQFFDDDDAPWNYMMAIAILYCLPPIAIFYSLRGYMAHQAL
jgi:ABC-type glycerol-3-phosphate transport system permease component